MVDKNRTEGKMKDVKGRVKEAWGEATGDTSKQAEGKADQVEGKIQEGYGRIKDEIRAHDKKAEERQEP